MNIGICGVGNYGYAILNHLAHKYKRNTDISLRAYEKQPEVNETLKQNLSHPFIFPDRKLEKKVTVVDSLEDLVQGLDVLILAINSPFIPDVLKEIKGHLKDGVIIVNTAKALSNEGLPYSKIFEELLEGKNYQYAIIAGGTIAENLFNHEVLGLDIAIEDAQTGRKLEELFESPTLRIFLTDDVTGVEYASSFKNLISVITGIVNGLGFSYGTETFLISRVSVEVTNLCVNYLGASAKTFDMSSQAWGNDMFMSATGNTRNRQFGILLGSGMSTEEAVAEMTKNKKAVESMNTIKTLKGLLKKHNGRFPILQALIEIVEEDKNARKVILDLTSNL